ncbi:MAG TPA: transporter [Candidatus Acetatifactor stercoripullorum]|uniref:Transporter n=1 Tax=Candidatus Acetatifactor stercoripullorum TaxID=2838414 RepID=A0A9D1UDJ2_9FIRM|nr:CAP domain-containing protein [uncultured Acetatifactor sp.]HIW82530.1 transporter [Candidatus Acetatifactor stercoripullorum]
MRKLTLLTAALLSTAALGSQTLTAQAAGNGWKNTVISKNGNRIVISYQENCDLSSLLEQWKDCFPSVNPSLPETDTDLPGSDTDIPEADLPDSNGGSPDAGLPDDGTDTPDSNLPDNEAETPDTSLPGSGTDSPETDKPGNDIESEDSENLSYAEQVIRLVNEERAKEGLSPLVMALDVQAAAQVRAEEIVTSFSHTRPNGSSFSTALKEQNVSYRGAGENIAWGQRSPEEVVNAWMNSAGHRANILNERFTTIGVGHYQKGSTHYWAQLFTY